MKQAYRNECGRVAAQRTDSTQARALAEMREIAIMTSQYYVPYSEYSKSLLN